MLARGFESILGVHVTLLRNRWPAYNHQQGVRTPSVLYVGYSLEARHWHMAVTIRSGISKTPGIQGGDACVNGTRIPVWVLVNYRRLGGKETDLLSAYPSLTIDDLKAAWEYADAHVEEIDRSIRQNEEGEDGLSE